MSIDAIRFALKVRAPALEKLVLISLADRANEYHQAWPSIARLSADTGMDRKTVISILQRLIQKGTIIDTGVTVGRTGRVKVYQLVGVEDRHHSETVPKTELFRSNSTESGTLNSTGSGTMNSTESGTLNQSREPIIERYIYQAEKILEFLNQKTGRIFRPKRPDGRPSSSAHLVILLLKSGYTESDIRMVIARQCREWGKDPKMASFLRPKTLFRASNFEDYLSKCA